jgi:hypothetical protein
MAFFKNLKHKKKELKNVHDNTLELKTHFETKLSLIQWLDDKN